MLDLTEGQQQRYHKIESELEDLRDTLENQEDNLRNMICNGCEEDNYDEVKKQRNFFKEWEEQEYADEFYDRSKANRFNKSKPKPKITKADIKENDTYESVKARLNIKMKEKDALMQKLIEINYETKQNKNTEEMDELEAFMEQNHKVLKNDEKEYVSGRLVQATEEIEKLNAMLTFLMPSSFSTAQRIEVKPTESSHKSKNKEASVKKQDVKSGGGLSEVFQKLSAMSKFKEVELNKKHDEAIEPEASGSIEMPRNYLPDEPVDVEIDVDGQAEAENRGYFSEILKNIQAVGVSDTIDTANYTNLIKEYTNFHKTKHYQSAEGTKRQKTSEESETTVIKFGGQDATGKTE
mmetsp:Transcript_7917/g.8983  ORF Transcript_7917/g.8983 Transcript_7917/m.8983 type:complete len:351 (-) Transcript_7917:21-1073(-)